MKKIICALVIALATQFSYADETPQPRISIFSTSTDWEAVTGLTLSEYRGTFIPDSKLVKKGLVLYYLDGFPCYGLGAGVRVWVGPNGQNHEHLHIACVAAPTEIKFAYLHASRDADDETTTGIITCPISDKGHDLTIDLSKCEIGPDWQEYK
ncbi:MAG: hypothetical protein R8M71_02690 [Alphaproteobacteria bacterium]|jgi:hypothetical protein|nr:hypothetical protein [Alphaproteobacteria bacterium]